MLLSIIMPVFNEEKSIRLILDKVISVKLPEGIKKEIIVVDDGSTDGTLNILKEYQNKGAVICHYSVLNFGKGAAIRVGLEYAGGDIILIQDADLEYNPSDYGILLEFLIKNNLDAVYGSRFKGEIEDMRQLNRLANKILTKACNFLYGVELTDAYTCYKLVRKDVLKNLNLKSTGFEIEAEITGKLLKRGHKIHEVPISYSGRLIKDGKKIKWSDGFTGLWNMIKCRFMD